MSANPGIAARADGQAASPATAQPDDRGTIVRVKGTVVGIRGLRRARLYDLVRVGPGLLPGEIIRLTGPEAVAQVYEPATGLRAGDPATGTGEPLSIELGPGLLGSILDGTARPLTALAAADGNPSAVPFLPRGAVLPTLDRDRRFEFRPAVTMGDEVGPGDRLGATTEAGGYNHPVLVPPGISGTVTAVRPGLASVTDAVAEINGAPLPMLQRWPVRQPRPVARRLDLTRPLATGQRVIDTLFPVAMLREDFLQQSSFDETDAYCPLPKQHAMLSVIVAAHEAMASAVSDGVPVEEMTSARVLTDVARMRAWPPGEAVQRAEELTRRITGTFCAQRGDTP